MIMQERSALVNISRTVVVDSLEQMCDLMCPGPEPENEHEYCLRCGRKLKNPEARILGYGVICYKKLKNQRYHKIPLF